MRRESLPHAPAAGSIPARLQETSVLACRARLAGVPRNWGVKVDQHSLMSAISQQPMSAAIEADQSVFQNYSGGSLSEDCGTNVDHDVPAIGYDTAEG